MTARSSHPAKWFFGKCRGRYSTLYRLRLGVGARSIGSGAGVAGLESSRAAPLLRLVYLRLAVGGAGEAVFTAIDDGDSSILMGGGTDLELVA
jgi:hypothetical protein